LRLTLAHSMPRRRRETKNTGRTRRRRKKKEKKKKKKKKKKRWKRQKWWNLRWTLLRGTEERRAAEQTHLRKAKEHAPARGNSNAALPTLPRAGVGTPLPTLSRKRSPHHRNGRPSKRSCTVQASEWCASCGFRRELLRPIRCLQPAHDDTTCTSLFRWLHRNISYENEQPENPLKIHMLPASKGPPDETQATRTRRVQIVAPPVMMPTATKREEALSRVLRTVMEASTHYETLGMKVEHFLEEEDRYRVAVKRSSPTGSVQLRVHYRRLCMQLHPDRCGDPSAEEAFKKVAHAYQVLNDRQQRIAYNRSLAQRRHKSAPSFPTSYARTPTARTSFSSSRQEHNQQHDPQQQRQQQQHTRHHSDATMHRHFATHCSAHASAASGAASASFHLSASGSTSTFESRPDGGSLNGRNPRGTTATTASMEELLRQRIPHDHPLWNLFQVGVRVR
jgi:DnaJ domain